MSQILIRKALENRLKAMSPALSTAFENQNFVPVNGTAYQRVNLLPAEPDNSIQGQGTYFERGLFQVTLCYPPNAGPNVAWARAELVKAHFKRGTSLTESGVTTIVMFTPRISPPLMEGDRYCIPISVPYQAQIST